jgi:hypothetical protein
VEQTDGLVALAMKRLAEMFAPAEIRQDRISDYVRVTGKQDVIQ